MKIHVLILGAAIAALPQNSWAQSELNLTPSRVVGQPSLTARSTNPNVPEGRSLFQPFAVAVDASSTPQAIFVADTRNNRVLGWRNAQTFANGAPAELILGQLDAESTAPLGPGTTRSLGFSAPGALVVDSRGSLYVLDTGNNRILRFTKPFASTEEIQTPDLVIGQTNFTTRTPNTGGISEKTIAVTTDTNANSSGLAFDAQGNLWFSDALNNRVLRYPKLVLDAATNGPSADVVLGQPDFKTSTIPNPGAVPRLNKGVLNRPSGIAVDGDGRVYVADSLQRAVVFAPPFTNGKEGFRILGVWINQPNQPVQTQYVMGNPEGMTVMNNRLIVADPGLSRIVRYEPAAEWPAETEAIPSPPATAVLGQADLESFVPNRGLAEASEITVANPFGVYAVGSELYVADTGNNRVLGFPSFGPTVGANRVLGQVAFNFSSPNIVEGREMFLYNGFTSGTNLADGGGVAIDTRSNPPRLYVADTYNNRILGYKDARNVRPNDVADIVIGQNDLRRALVNAPQNNQDIQTDSGLNLPTGLVVDTNGDLFVADSRNGRVLRFPSPFAQTLAPGERPRANLVLGQRNFTTKVTDPSRFNMAYPFGLALTVERHLVVSDAAHNRVLYFQKPAGADFTNGMAAEKVIGQPDFFTVARATGPNRMFSPRHIALDTDDRLYVTDSGNDRVLIFDRIPSAANDPPVAFTIQSLSNPQGIWVSPLTGEIWIANTRGNQAIRYPRFVQLSLGVTSDYRIPSSTPLALTQDRTGNLFVAEAVNRTAVYFNGLRTQVAGSYAERPLTPGGIGIVYPRGTNVSFTTETKVFNELPNPIPLPKELADIEVLLDNRSLPLYFVSPGQINFFIPMDIASSGSAEVQVVRKSVGEIIGAGSVTLARVAPSLFIQGGQEQGTIAAINTPDGTVNDPTNAIAKGQVVALFGTGYGFVPGAPAEGMPPTGPLPGEEQISVLVGTRWLDPGDIQYFGLAPGLVGVYQINIRIPDFVAPSVAVDVVVQTRSTNSNVGTGGKILKTTIAVKP